MAENEVQELVFIAVPGMGHLLPTVRLAERIVAQSRSSNKNQISAVILVMKTAYQGDKLDSYIKSVKSRKQSTGEESHFTLLELPPVCGPSINSLTSFLDAYKVIIEQILHDRYQQQASSSSTRLTGFVLDISCSCMMGITEKLGVPIYIFNSSGAAPLNLSFRLEALQLNIPATFGGDDQKKMIDVPGFRKPVPTNVWPEILLDHTEVDGSQMFFDHVTRTRRAKGIIVNTFMELESSLIQSLSSSSSSSTNHGGLGSIPTIYPVGPIVNIKDDSSHNDDRNHIIKWLDSQPLSSVVFLCFGSRGSFTKEEVKEIAAGLEQSGQRFLWSLLKPPSEATEETNYVRLPPTEYEDYNQVLPEGFLNRTANIGKVIGWTPQVAVLSHKAVGAFLSHCGWNSTIESLWFGVPMLAWPMYAEQQLNAFLLVKELGLAVEIKLNYKCDPAKGVPNMIVKAEEVEKGIRKLMEEDEGLHIRQRVKNMSQIARTTLLEESAAGGGGGSSYRSMGHFLDQLLNNV